MCLNDLLNNDVLHCNHKVVSQLIQPEVQAEDVCGFLWEHLVNDVRNVSISLERSEDEVLLMIHLVLSEIMSRSIKRKPIWGSYHRHYYTTIVIIIATSRSDTTASYSNFL